MIEHVPLWAPNVIGQSIFLDVKKTSQTWIFTIWSASKQVTNFTSIKWVRNCVNRKRITFANYFYYIGFRIPLFRMLFQHNHSLHFRGEQTRSTSIFNTGFFNTLYNSYQKGSITLSRSSLMYIGVSEIISNLKRNFSVQKLNTTDKGEKNYPSWN